MSKVVDDLKKIVDQVAREGTLTPEAIRQFDTMRESLLTAERELEQTRKYCEGAQRDAAEKAKKIEFLEVALKVRIEEVDKLYARERDFDRMAWLYNHEVDRRMDMRGIVSEVFKNFETAREFTKLTPVPMSNSGNTWIQEHATRENVVERTRKEP